MSRYIILLAITAMAACNPTRRIDMRNNSGKDVTITWLLKEEDSLYRSFFFISNSTETVIHLQSQHPYHLARMSFGMGAWKPDTLRRIIAPLAALRIQSASGLMELTQQEEIFSFLWNRRTGLTKRKIAIVVPPASE